MLVQGKDGLKVGDPQFTAAVDDVVDTLGRPKHVERGREPATRKGNEGNVSATAAPRSSPSSSPATRTPPRSASSAPLAAVAALQKAHPEVALAQFGDASAEKEIGEAFEEDFQKAEVLSLPITL